MTKHSMTVKASTIIILSMVPLQHCYPGSRPICSSALLSYHSFTHSFLYQILIAYSVPGAGILPRDDNCEQDRPDPCPRVAYVLQEPKLPNREHHMISETCDLSWELA